jgi:hypothetical protein
MADSSKTEVIPEELQESIQRQAEGYWTKLKPLFPRAQMMPAPKVVFTTPEAVDMLPSEDGRYISESHSIAFNITKPDAATPLSVSEEVTHAATFVEGEEIWRFSDSLSDFDGFRPGFGKRLQREAERIGLFVVPMNINEYFAPIGQAYLLGDEYPLEWAWEKAFPKDAFTFPVTEKESELYTRIFEHLPRLAGELLVKSYDKDIPRLVRENTEMFSSTRDSIWEDYCVPLLKTGKLK